MKHLLVTTMLAASLVLAGCSPENPVNPVAHYADQVKQVIAALDAVHDEDSAMAAVDTYQSLIKSAEALASLADAAAPAERTVLSTKYFRMVEAGDVRIKQHMRKLKPYPKAIAYGHLESLTGTGTGS
jgi:outer membrane murein-binding lipoprotein Lpp